MNIENDNKNNTNLHISYINDSRVGKKKKYDIYVNDLFYQTAIGHQDLIEWIEQIKTERDSNYTITLKAYD